MSSGILGEKEITRDTGCPQLEKEAGRIFLAAFDFLTHLERGIT